METIHGKGNFVRTVSALASGDVSAILLSSVGLKDLQTLFYSLDHAGFSRKSRRGWSTVDHPDLGNLQWKLGCDFRTTGQYLFLRLNGELILKAWPKSGNICTHAEWLAQKATILDNYFKTQVENYLGVLKWW